MATVAAKDFIKDAHADNTNDSISKVSGLQDKDRYYLFDSKKTTELQRLDEQHHALVELAKNRLVHSPIQSPKRVLDIGCGTGITTVTLAGMFPAAEVVGLDMNPVPPIHDKPANVTYIQARIEDIVQRMTESNENKTPNEDQGGEILQRNSFDYIFTRYLVLAIPDWPSFISTCVSLLAPGGWLEMQESAAFELYTAASPTKPLNTSPSYPWDWTNVVFAESEKKGYDFRIGKRLHSHFLEHGLNGVVSQYYPQCIHAWPGREETGMMADYMSEYAPATFPLMLAMFTKEASAEQREAWNAQITEMFEPGKAREGLHWRFYAVCGRKENRDSKV